MKKQHLSKHPNPSRRRFLQTMALGSVGILGGLTLLTATNTQTVTTTERAGRAFSASTRIDIETPNEYITGRQAV